MHQDSTRTSRIFDVGQTQKSFSLTSISQDLVNNRAASHINSIHERLNSIACVELPYTPDAIPPTNVQSHLSGKPSGKHGMVSAPVVESPISWNLTDQIFQSLCGSENRQHSLLCSLMVCHLSLYAVTATYDVMSNCRSKRPMTAPFLDGCTCSSLLSLSQWWFKAANQSRLHLNVLSALEVPCITAFLLTVLLLFTCTSTYMHSIMPGLIEMNDHSCFSYSQGSQDSQLLNSSFERNEGDYCLYHQTKHYCPTVSWTNFHFGPKQMSGISSPLAPHYLQLISSKSPQVTILRSQSGNSVWLSKV